MKLASILDYRGVEISLYVVTLLVALKIQMMYLKYNFE